MDKDSKKAVVLLSGGLDSATCLAVAKKRGFSCSALTISYGQRHGRELAAARRIAETVGVDEHRVLEVALGSLGGSALTDMAIAVPKDGPGPGIPPTYVPARNLLFLSLAAAYAETICAGDIFIGVNSVDYSGYPDCRPEFIKALEECIRLGTKTGSEGSRGIRIQCPLQNMGKSEIISLGLELGVDYSETHSCYDPDDSGKPCGLCDSCRIRRRGFEKAGKTDPAVQEL